MPSRKGSPNRPKRQLLALLQEKFPGYHPVVEMATIANDEEAAPELRAQMHKEVAQYVEPKRKAIDITSGGESVAFNFTMKLKG